MSDLISREALCHHLKRIIDSSSNSEGYNEGFNDGLEFAISDAATMPSAQQWIPCSERLPIIQDEEMDTFFVTYYDNDSPNQLLVGMMIFHDGIWYKPECDKVIAWQPLPKPYKEDK